MLVRRPWVRAEWHRFLWRPLVLSTALRWHEVLKAAHLDRAAVAVMKRNRLLPAPLDSRNHSLFRVRLFVLSPSRHRIAADEHRNRRRRDADGKAPCVAPVVLGLLQDKPLLAFVQKLHRQVLRDLRDRRVEDPFGALA